MRNRLLRSAVIIPLVLLIGALSGPVYASALRNTSVRAYGASLSLLNSVIIPPTPDTTAGPQPGTGSDALLNVPLSNVLTAQAAGAKSVTTLESTLTGELPAQNLRTISPAGAPVPDRFNAKGYARVAGAGLLFSGIPEENLPPEVGALVTDILGAEGGLGLSVLTADAVDSVALLSCVNGAPVVVAGSRIIGLNVLGQNIELNDTLNQVVEVVDTVLGTIGARITANEVIPAPAGQVGVQINALHIEIPLLGLDVVLAHSEVSAPADQACEPIDRPECSDGIDNDGDGLIDAADPGCHTDGDANNPASYDPNDDSEANILPRTGGNNALLGATILAGGALLLETQRRRRAKAAHI